MGIGNWTILHNKPLSFKGDERLVLLWFVVYFKRVPDSYPFTGLAFGNQQGKPKQNKLFRKFAI
jgi:hypothetical protein